MSEDKIRELREARFVCPGPSRTGGFGRVGFKGVELCVSTCMVMAACGCAEYDRRVAEIAVLEEAAYTDFDDAQGDPCYNYGVKGCRTCQETGCPACEASEVEHDYSCGNCKDGGCPSCRPGWFI